MRHIALAPAFAPAFAPAAALAAPARASRYVSMQGTAESQHWKGKDGLAPGLRSKNGKGATLAAIAPNGRDGLHRGDRLTAVDRSGVAHLEDLLTYANAHVEDPAERSVDRTGHAVNVALAAGGLRALVHPAP